MPAVAVPTVWSEADRPSPDGSTSTSLNRPGPSPRISFNCDVSDVLARFTIPADVMGLTPHTIALIVFGSVVRFDGANTSAERLVARVRTIVRITRGRYPRCGYSQPGARQWCAHNRQRSSTTPNLPTGLRLDGHASPFRSTA